mgnify:CR=1 FL=1
MVGMLPKPTSCLGCPIYGDGIGFIPPTTSGGNGVLIVAEAGGENEAKDGIQLCGKAGYYLFSQLTKAGLKREDFWLQNVLSCQPRMPGFKDNFLAGAPYEAAAVAHCAPNLDRTIADHKVQCERLGKHQVILTLGDVAFRRVMGIEKGDPILREDYHGYIFHTDRYDCWVIAAYHPSFLMRGQHQYVPCLQYAALRAVEVAAEGFTYDEPDLLLDPPPETFERWVASYVEALGRDPLNTFLSCDIETPKKSKKGEDQLAREDDEDYIILRVSFSYRPDGAVSIPWTAAYMPVLERLFGDSRNQLVFWNENYDLPRVRVQLDVAGSHIDGMLAWHVLNSALDKRLGFVTPYYAKRARLWKHESTHKPAYYNALDALRALQNWLGIREDLRRAGQLEVFERHVLQLNRLLNRMSAAGLPRDEQMRTEAETHLTTLLTDIEARISGAVPEQARQVKVYKGKPRLMEGVRERTATKRMPVCTRCGMIKPPKAHAKVYKKKVNPCAGAAVEDQPTEYTQYYKEIEWCPSGKQLLAYQFALKHQAIFNRERGTVTFDENAITALMRKYPRDPLYPCLLEHRKVQKLRGTYIGVTQEDGSIKGGLRVGRDGRVHCELTHNPNTLRLAAQYPNLQNLPRIGADGDLGNVVRNLIYAGEGYTLVELDYSAIEAVLTAYFARWPEGIRLAKQGIHSYVASHVLGRPADLKWSDADLKAYFKEIKKSPDAEVQRVYNACKRCVHGSAYGMSPRKMVMSEPETFPHEAYARRIQDIFFEVAAPIRKWHLQTQLEAHTNGYLRNPFSYVLRFSHVFRNVKENGKWVRKPGDQANEALAFLPQSTAAGIIKEAMLALPEEVVCWLRLQVHDSLLFRCLTSLTGEVYAGAKSVMEAPVRQLPLPASYGMGTHLSIDVDGKCGPRWGSMREVT